MSSHPFVLLLAALLLWAWLSPTQAFTAFDCEHPNATFSDIDLTAPQECPDPIQDFHPEMELLFQIVQLDTLTPATAYQCKVSLTKEVTRCGWQSITFGHDYPAYRKLLEITPEQCRQAVQNGTLYYQNQAIPVRPNERRTHRYYSHGRRHHDGYCEVTNFHSEGRYYESSYEETQLVIRITLVRAQIDESTGLITMANGLRAPFKDKVLQDSIEGTIVWDVPSPTCERKIAELYFGRGKIKRRKGREGLLDAVAVVRDPKRSRFAGFVLRNARTLCGADCYTAQGEDGLALCPARGPNLRSLSDAKPLTHAQADLTHLEVKTHIMYMHTSLHLHLQDQFALINNEMCKMDRRTMSTRLQSIAGVDNPYALTDLFGRGVTIRKAGATAYVTKCVPVEVNLATMPNCSLEIPVLRAGSAPDTPIEFVDPLSYVLKSFPVLVPCSALMPIKWKIGDEWTCANPAPTPCHTDPTQMNTTFGQLPRMDLFLDALGNGLFTKEQLQQHRLFVQTQETRAAVAARATNNAVLQSTSGRLGLSVAEEDIPELATRISLYINPFAYFSGEWWIYIWGFLVIVGLLKVIAGCVIRAAILYRKRGCGWWMLSAIWSTTFMAAAYPIQLIRRAVSAILEPLQQLPGEDPEKDPEKGPVDNAPGPVHPELPAQLEELRRLQDVLMSRYDALLLARQEGDGEAQVVPNSHVQAPTG